MMRQLARSRSLVRRLAALVALAPALAQAQTAPPAEGAPAPVEGAAATPSVQPTLTPLPIPAATAPKSAPSGLRVLSLEEALNTALRAHPRLQQASAVSRAADARANQAFAPLLPQVSANATYQRSTANPVPRAGQFSAAAPSSRFDTYGFFSFGIQASQLIYDFGQTGGRYQAARANAQAQHETEEAARLDVSYTVKNAYFAARADKALVLVAREALANQERHLAQVQGFVEVGTRPRIDLVQAKADRESAQLALVNAENAYAIAKVQLAQAIGYDSSVDFDVADDSIAPLAEEERSGAQLLHEALNARPDVRAQNSVIHAQELSEKAVKGGYGPTLSASTALTESGSELDAMRWNWNAQATLNWPIFQGGITKAQVAEAKANVDNASAQARSLRQQVLVEVEQARVTVRGAKQALATSQVLVENSRERLTLAEGRYQIGVGSIIELADAQLALTQAQAQLVEAEFNLSSARAALARALGRR